MNFVSINCFLVNRLTGVSLSVLQRYNNYLKPPNLSKYLNIRHLKFRHTFCNHLAMSRENAIKPHIESNFNQEGHFQERVYNIIFFKKMSLLHFLDGIDIDSYLFRLPAPIALRENACNAIV